MNQRKIISVELNMPDNVITMLKNINNQLNSITSASNNTTNSFREIGNTAATFNSIRMALGTLSAATVKASGVLATFKTIKVATGTATAASQLMLEAHTASTLKSTIASGAMTKAEMIAGTVKALLAGKIGLVTAAQWLWNIAMKANPIGAVIVAIAALIAGIALLVTGVRRLVGWLFRTREATTACGKSISDLADEFGRSTEEIEADMERLGTTCLDVWYGMERGVRELADEWNMCVDEIREQALELGGDYQRLGQHMQTLNDIGEQFGLSMSEVADTLERQGVPEVCIITVTWPLIAKAALYRAA